MNQVMHCLQDPCLSLAAMYNSGELKEKLEIALAS